MATATFKEQVNDAVSQMTTSDDGKWSLPDTITDEAVKYAADLERRRRDTQSELAKVSAKASASEAETKNLGREWEESQATIFTPDQQTELEELKSTDPDAWRLKLNDLEKVNRTKLTEKRKEIKTKSVNESQLERRKRELAEFQEANPTIEISDEVIANEIPPKYTRQLEAGELSFSDYLAACGTFLSAGKTIGGGAEAVTEPNLSNVGGGSKPTSKGVEDSISTSYDKTIF